MNSRNRAKSLPSLRIEAQNQPGFVVTDVPAVPALPPQHRSLTVAKTRTRPVQSLLPAWDREIDVTFHKHIQSDTGNSYNIIKTLNDDAASDVFETARIANTDLESHTYAAIISILNYVESRKDPSDDNFRRVVNCLHQSRGRPVSRNEMCFLFKFPEMIRRKIWNYILTDEPCDISKPVRLQPFNPFFKEVWTRDGFQSINEIFSSSWGAMSTCYALRIELLASVLTTRRFHIIFSPFVKEQICPQMFHWIDSWSQLMDNLTIELDLSKLGFGPTLEAGDLLWGDCNIAAGMRRFVSTQVTNRTTQIKNLILMARRYHGIRRNLANSSTPRPYCPPEADFAAVAAITKIKGRVNKLRIVGFNASTTNTIIESIFPEIDFANKEELQKHGGMVGISRIWPLLDGQASIHRNANFPEYAEPPLLLPRTVSGIISTTTRNVSKTRSQIEKLKDLLATYESKKQRGQEVKIPLDQQIDMAETVISKAPPILQRSTVHLRSNGKTSIADQIKRGMPKISPAQPDLFTDSQSGVNEQTTRQPSTPSVPVFYTAETEMGKTHSQVYAGFTASKQHDRLEKIQSFVGSEDCERARQANEMTVENQRHGRRQETKPIDDEKPRKDFKWSLKNRAKSMSRAKGMNMSMRVPTSSYPSEAVGIIKGGPTGVLHRKKSFGDFLRGNSRFETGNGPKVLDQDPLKSYFDFDEDKDTKGLWRAISLRDNKFKLRK